MKTIVEHLINIPPEWEDRIVYMAKDSRLTYGATRQIMLQTAAWLIYRYGVTLGQQVALCLPMGMTAAQITLGVLAAGASYLPLQFNGPPERLKEIFVSSECTILITTPAMAEKLGEVVSAVGVIEVITLTSDFISFERMLNQITALSQPVKVDPEELAAVFFTSGSTGQPKGVMMSRRSMTETAFILAGNVPLEMDDRLMMLAPLHYASSLGIFFPLPSGSATYIASEGETMFAQIVAEILERERITVWDGPVSRLRHLVESSELDHRDLSSLRYIEFFGERMPIECLNAATMHFPNAEFQNTYGSSEAFWMSTFTVHRNLLSDLSVLPIGKPLSCYDFGLYEEDGTPVAAGETGEICVVGPVAIIGYWKRPDLTNAARLNGIPNSYRTGDLARLAPDGNYHFAGRRDHQVKINGHRFELGEIEAVLKSHPSVREAVAFFIDDEVRACILVDASDYVQKEMAAICVKRLPVFARPKFIKTLTEFPRLSSGKIDRIELLNSI